MVVMNGLIAHQLDLAKPQIQKLINGLPVNISFHKMGSGVGDVVAFLHPHNAKKLLSSYHKGKGIRLQMSPEEIHHSIHYGRGFFDTIKKGAKFISQALHHPVVKAAAKTGIDYGANAVGTAVGSYFGSPEIGSMIGSTLGSAASSALDSGDVKVGINQLKDKGKKEGMDFANDAVSQQIKKLPPKYQDVAQTAFNSAIKGEIPSTTDLIDKAGVHHEAIGGFGLYGGGKGSPAMKAKMAKLRAMKGKGVGGKINILNSLKKAFNPHTITNDLKTVGHYVIPAATGALGGIAGSLLAPETGGLSSVAGSALGSYAGQQIDKQLGIGIKKRGRPKKGKGVYDSSAYQNAMFYNPSTYGLVLDNGEVSNKPVSAFKTDPRVKPSSTEMTLSPYLSSSSPAMNPFVPTSYYQEGGVSSGYGQGVPYSNIYGSGTKMGDMRKTARRAYDNVVIGSGTKKGMMRHTARRAYEGQGLYGGGLF
jgi:hypothetical protein